MFDELDVSQIEVEFGGELANAFFRADQHRLDELANGRGLGRLQGAFVARMHHGSADRWDRTAREKE